MSGYVMDLRKIVGHRPLLQVGASVIVEDELRSFAIDELPENIFGPFKMILDKWIEGKHS